LVYVFSKLQIHNGSQKGAAYELDRKTGKTWMIYGSKKVEAESESSEGGVGNHKTLPYEERAKLAGRANLNEGSFSGRIYNGSDWTVKELVVIIKALEKDGTQRWKRRFQEKITIKPLTTGYFSIIIVDGGNADSFEWNIAEASGYSP